MPVKEVETTLYHCDPDRNKRCPKTGCYINNGPCHLTTNPDFAKIGTVPVKEKYMVYVADEEDDDN